MFDQALSVVLNMSGAEGSATDFVHTLAAECASARADQAEACPFMIQSDLRDGQLVKIVMFEEQRAAERFRSMVAHRHPRLLSHRS